MKLLTIGLAVFLLLCACGTRVEAQDVASSFDQLSVLVQPGDKITVVDLAGREGEGRVAMLSRDTLALLTPAGPRQLSEAEVALIRQRREDSLVNGAIIGAVAGTAYVATAIAILGDSDGGEMIVSTAIVTGVMFAGIGAAAGAGIDALIARRQVIFRNPAQNRVRVSPLLGHGRLGAAMAVKF